MINKLLCNSHITLFSRFEHVNDRDLDYIENYKDYYIPVYLDNVMLKDTTITNTSSAGNTSLGDFNLVLALKNHVTRLCTCGTRAYREINNEVFELEYIDHAKYALLSYDDQAYKYFTIKQNYFFTNEQIKPLQDKIPIKDIAHERDYFKTSGVVKYNIENIEVGRSGTGIISIRGRL